MNEDKKIRISLSALRFVVVVVVSTVVLLWAASSVSASGPIYSDTGDEVYRYDEIIGGNGTWWSANDVVTSWSFPLSVTASAAPCDVQIYGRIYAGGASRYTGNSDVIHIPDTGSHEVVIEYDQSGSWSASSIDYFDVYSGSGPEDTCGFFAKYPGMSDSVVTPADQLYYNLGSDYYDAKIVVNGTYSLTPPDSLTVTPYGFSSRIVADWSVTLYSGVFEYVDLCVYEDGESEELECTLVGGPYFGPAYESAASGVNDLGPWSDGEYDVCVVASYGGEVVGMECDGVTVVSDPAALRVLSPASGETVSGTDWNFGDVTVVFDSDLVYDGTATGAGLSWSVATVGGELCSDDEVFSAQNTVSGVGIGYRLNPAVACPSVGVDDFGQYFISATMTYGTGSVSVGAHDFYLGAEASPPASVGFGSYLSAQLGAGFEALLDWAFALSPSTVMRLRGYFSPETVPLGSVMVGSGSATAMPTPGPTVEFGPMSTRSFGSYLSGYSPASPVLPLGRVGDAILSLFWLVYFGVVVYAVRRIFSIFALGR